MRRSALDGARRRSGSPRTARTARARSSPGSQRRAGSAAGRRRGAAGRSDRRPRCSRSGGRGGRAAARTASGSATRRARGRRAASDSPADGRAGSSEPPRAGAGSSPRSRTPAAAAARARRLRAGRRCSGCPRTRPRQLCSGCPRRSAAARATLSNPSASEIALHTWTSSISASHVSFRRVETSSRRSSASRFAFARAVSWAASTAIAACSETATRTSISSPLGLRPESGSSTDRIPSRRPSLPRIGTKSASSGCHAPGSSLTWRFGVYTLPLYSSQSNSPGGNDVGAALQEAPVEQRLPVVDLAHLAEQRLARPFAAVDGADHEVVPFAAVEVDDHRPERERVGDRPRDRQEEVGQLVARPDEARHLEQSAQPREDRRLTQIDSRHRTSSIGCLEAAAVPRTRELRK